MLGLIQLAVTPLLLGWIAAMAILDMPARLERWDLLAVYAGAYLVVRFAVSGLYLIDRLDMPRRQKLLSWALGTPASIALNVAVLMPARYHALLRLGDAQWSNRDLQRGRYRAQSRHRLAAAAT